MTIIATVGGSNSNSYVTLAEANQYHSERLHNEEWTNADDTTKEAGLLWATKVLDANFKWEGEIKTTTQALDWPRYSVYDKNNILVDSDIIPIGVKNAQSELAFLLITDDRTLSADEVMNGISEAKASVLTVKFDQLAKQAMLSTSVIVYIQEYGTFYGAGTNATSSTMKVVRT